MTGDAQTTDAAVAIVGSAQPAPPEPVQTAPSWTLRAPAAPVAQSAARASTSAGTATEIVERPSAGTLARGRFEAPVWAPWMVVALGAAVMVSWLGWVRRTRVRPSNGGLR